MNESDDRAQCEALTKAGSQCRNRALPDSAFCRIHRHTATRAVEATPLADPVAKATADAVTGTMVEGAASFDDEARHELASELDTLIARLQALRPDYTPPPFSPQRLVALLEENLRGLAPDIQLGILERLRGTLNEDLLDPDTWKGMWYMLNYTLEYQADRVKRRMTGDYETDEWGMDPELLELVNPFFDFLYHKYWRVETTGIEKIPAEGSALLVMNHSGQLPWDGAMVGAAVRNEHPAQRLVRNLYATWFPTLPFLSNFLVKIGQVQATEENGTRLLEQGELVGVFPEGYKGVGKLFKDRYRLARFGRGGFVKMALRAGAPMIPISVVGAEEIYPTLAQSKRLARLAGFPYFPITIAFPWLGPLGVVPLPTKWFIDVGDPIPTDGYEADAADNMLLVSQLTNQVRDTIQQQIYDRLGKRRSVFFG